MSKQVNDAIRVALSQVTGLTAETAAKAVYDAIVPLALAMGHNPAIEVAIRKPGDKRHTPGDGTWQVVWEAGPHEWAISASTVVGDFGILAEPYYSFDLDFYDN